jgi:para-aminobenzoate synthetase component 1
VPTEREGKLRRPITVPVERLGAIVGQWPGAALLESGEGFGPPGRWSIFAARPRLVYEATSHSWRIKREDRPAETGKGDPLGRLALLLAELGLAQPGDTPDPNPDAPPFRGGLIGYFGYDLAPRLERLPRKASRESRMPDIRFALHDAAIVADHDSGLVEFQAYDVLGEGEAALERRWEEWHAALARTEPRTGLTWLRPPRSNFLRAEFLQAARKALEYIRAGDVFQVNLSQRFESRDVGSPICRPDPLTLYLRLKTRSPAPYSAYLRWKDLAIVSSSPELFFATSGRRIVTRPIKGTRPRGADDDEDALLRADLISSAKDRAELTMIVDLERNDLGRVCEYGSVRVVDPMSVESFAQVHHLVATVDGRLRPDVGPIDVIRAVFPGGSITGAPKIRAMEIIDELEPNRRGVYTGAIGFFSRGGTSRFNIAIRTLLVEGDRVHYHVGGGIVADSDPEAEYLETLHKGRGLREVLEWHGTWPGGNS